MAVKFEMINTESVDLAGQIQTQAAPHFGAQMNPFSLQLVQLLGHSKHVVKDRELSANWILLANSVSAA
jgi:hypothetical protein